MHKFSSTDRTKANNVLLEISNSEKKTANCDRPNHLNISFPKLSSIRMTK
uniref:Uncharacterized protein n=1 Tax=Arundo donax TaxID=35708 RepID=A0A0A8ZIJ3_ARUDO